MSVLVLTYHKTPARCSGDLWDVSLSQFCSHIDALIDMRVNFIKFSDLLDRRFFDDQKTHVCITFDDGHKSNLQALSHLRERHIVPAAFIVGNWCKHDPEYLSLNDIVGLADTCEFGVHGLTHRALTDLSDQELESELTEAQALLADALGRDITTMTAPGGKLNRKAVSVARRLGFTLIGNSLPLINYRAATTINRVTIRSNVAAPEVRHLINAHHHFWLARRFRLAASSTLLNMLGEGRYHWFRSFMIAGRTQ